MLQSAGTSGTTVVRAQTKAVGRARRMELAMSREARLNEAIIRVSKRLAAIFPLGLGRKELPCGRLVVAT